RAEAVAETLRNPGTFAQPRMQVRAERAFGMMPADRARHRIERDDVAGALPDRPEMRVAQQARRRELLDVADAAAHLERIAAYFSRIARRTEFQHRRQDPHQRGGLLAAGLRAIERVRRQK